MSESSSDTESIPFLDILKSDMTCWEKSTRVVGKLLHSHAFQVHLSYIKGPKIAADASVFPPEKKN